MAILLSFCSQSRNILVYVVYGRWRVYKNGGTWNPANICLRSLRIRKSLFVSIHCDIRIHDWLVFNVRVIDWSFRGKIQKYRRGKYFFYLKCRNVEFAKRMFYCLMCNIYIYIYLYNVRIRRFGSGFTDKHVYRSCYRWKRYRKVQKSISESFHFLKLIFSRNSKISNILNLIDV